MIRLLDLFSCDGGAALGYKRAGLHVTGVDIGDRSSTYLGDDFVQADVVNLDPEWVGTFDVVHASPPCQLFTPARHSDNHPNLIPPTRDLLEAAGALYIIENVPAAHRYLRRDLLLCGSMFGLQVQRHRIFETNIATMVVPPKCCHKWRYGRPITVTGHADGPSVWAETSRDRTKRKYLGPATAKHAAEVMGMPPGLPMRSYSEAIPPAFTAWIGTQVINPQFTDGNGGR